MWPAIVLAAVLVALRSQSRRWADVIAWCLYGAYLFLAVLYIPARAGIHLHSPDCEWTFDLRSAVYSLGNYQHIVLCACFFVMTFVMLRGVRHPFLWSGVLTVAIGLLAEFEEGAARFHHCRMRDLIPDTTGAVIAAAVILIVRKLKARTI